MRSHGHPDIGEKILIVGSGKAAHDTAQVAWDRRDAGFRIVGFVSENGHVPGESLGTASVLGTTGDLEEIIKDKGINRIVTAVRERRGTFPTETLLKMSLAGDVSIEECTFFLRAGHGSGAIGYASAVVADLCGSGKGNEIEVHYSGGSSSFACGSWSVAFSADNGNYGNSRETRFKRTCSLSSNAGWKERKAI